MEILIEPKAIHDEMNAAAFDEFGRMTANIGLEVYRPLRPCRTSSFTRTSTRRRRSSTPRTCRRYYSADGITMTPISPISSADGTQIWKITHNGVDTHPIHWHLYDVQVLNRVTWDKIMILPDANELGWKDTLRTSPPEDTIVAIRPIIPSLPLSCPTASAAASTSADRMVNGIQ